MHQHIPLFNDLTNSVSTIYFIVPVKIRLGQHILRRPVSAVLPILATILFERLADVLEGQLADTEADRDPDSCLGMVADLHRPTTDVADIANASTATDRQSRAR